MAWIGAGTWREARKVENGDVVVGMMMMKRRTIAMMMMMIMMTIRMKMKEKVVLSHTLSGHELRQFVLRRVKKSVLLETRTEFKRENLRGK